MPVDASGYQSQIAELEETIKAKEASQKEPELTSLENTRDQVSEGLQVEATAANLARIEDSERLTRISNQENWRTHDANSLRSRGRTQSGQLFVNGTFLNRDISKVRVKICYKQRGSNLSINAQHIEERKSQYIKVKVLQDALDVQDNTVDIDIVPDHRCDHSKCV